MASESRRTTYPSSAASRASLACVPCRQKHVKCDAKRPVCDRCAAEDKTCHFLNSRRGGLTRSALAERRRVLQDGRQSSPAGESVQFVPSEFDSGRQQEEFSIQPTADEGYASRSAALFSSTPADPGSTSVQDLLDQDWNASSDHYVGLYYQHFHHLHPCVLPRKHLDKMLEDTSGRSRLELLLSVIRSIGTLYSPFSQRRQDKIVNRISSGIDPVQDAFLVQSLLLNSIALYWCGQEESSREEMDHAISIALAISMHSCTFATAHGLGNPILEESWRRTWWQLCIVDAYYAAMLHQTSPLMCRPDVTTDLPCEESEYEAGVCLPLHSELPITAIMATDHFGDHRSFLFQENSKISIFGNSAPSQTTFHHLHILSKCSELSLVRWRVYQKIHRTALVNTYPNRLLSQQKAGRYCFRSPRKLPISKKAQRTSSCFRRI
jgi:hypothetical protein